MRSPLNTPFAVIFQNEVLLNTKRVAPYVLMVIICASAVMSWANGLPVKMGWATNSDFFIARCLKAFSFILGVPIYNALIMGDPVTRDFRLGLNSLVFSKPISQAQYLFGRFFGAFFVLVCCLAVFPLTLLVLQAVHPPGMVVQPFKVLPYFQHFFFFVVITQLLIAACYFTAGALTRNTKVVYGLAICFYPVYVTAMLLFVRPLSVRWKSFLDLFLLNSGPSNNGFGNSADYLNQYIVSYTPDMIWNRVLVILASVVCLTWVYVRFTLSERSKNLEASPIGQTLGLWTSSDQVYFDSGSLQQRESVESEKAVAHTKVLLPRATKLNQVHRSVVRKLLAALRIEFQLLRSERSLVILVPLAVSISIVDLAFFPVAPLISYSATYASGTANTLLVFLIGVTVFYTGEAISRDREQRVEPILWTMPTTNNVFLLSKFLASLALALSIIALVGFAAIIVQLVRGHTPVSLSAYLITYGLILVPTVIFVTGLSTVLNVVLRSKYLAYVVCVGIGAGLYYLYSEGQNDWLYNPALYHLWSYPDLTSAGDNHTAILVHRLYCLAISGFCLAMAHLFFQRLSPKALLVDGRLTGSAWSILVAVISTAIAATTGWIVMSLTH